MARTLSDEDIHMVAAKVVETLAARLGAKDQPTDNPALPQPKPEPATVTKQKLAYSLKELASELGVSKVSIYRLEARGLIKALPYLRTKVYAAKEVERFLNEGRNWLK